MEQIISKYEKGCGEKFQMKWNIYIEQDEDFSSLDLVWNKLLTKCYTNVMYYFNMYGGFNIVLRSMLVRY